MLSSKFDIEFIATKDMPQQILSGCWVVSHFNGIASQQRIIRRCCIFSESRFHHSSPLLQEGLGEATPTHNKRSAW